jgi:hypothetical protein
MLRNIHLASMSQVKLDAVVNFLKSHNIKQFTPAETNCPQPVGYSNAIECLELRMSNQELCKKDIYLAIENCIEEDNGNWHDYCVVMAKYFQNDWKTVVVRGPISFPVPPQFAPTGPCDLPLGYSQTIGSKIHSLCPEIPEDNWMHDRVYQIIEALKKLPLDLPLSSCKTGDGSTVYIVLHIVSYTTSMPPKVVGVFMSEEQAIQSLVDDVHEYEKEVEPYKFTSQEIIIKYKTNFCLGEDQWSIQETKLK